MVKIEDLIELKESGIIDILDKENEDQDYCIIKIKDKDYKICIKNMNTFNTFLICKLNTLDNKMRNLFILNLLSSIIIIIIIIMLM